MILGNSRVKDIKGLKETGRKFSISEPMHNVINRSQKSYRALMLDMKKQMRLMRKQMAGLQREMNDVMKMMDSDKKLTY